MPVTALEYHTLCIASERAKFLYPSSTDSKIYLAPKEDEDRSLLGYRAVVVERVRKKTMALVLTKPGKIRGEALEMLLEDLERTAEETLAELGGIREEHVVEGEKEEAAPEEVVEQPNAAKRSGRHIKAPEKDQAEHVDAEAEVVGKPVGRPIRNKANGPILEPELAPENDGDSDDQKAPPKPEHPRRNNPKEKELPIAQP
jgi:hypothetical protein